MTIKIKAPAFPESVADGTVATWHKKPGEAVARDEPLVDIETDKVVLEVLAPADGKLTKVFKQEGEIILGNELIGEFEAGEISAGAANVAVEKDTSQNSATEIPASPAARKLMVQNNLQAEELAGSGKDGRITKEDVVNYLKADSSESAPDMPAPPPKEQAPSPSIPAAEIIMGDRPSKRVPMTRLRATIAKRLVQAQQTAAMLTTYNEVDMEPVMSLRTKYKAEFEKAHGGVRLGYMSFFVMACVHALKRFPAVNASIDGDEMVYHGYQDIGVAVSSDKGLVVPVLRNAETMSMADIEAAIANYGAKARDGKLAIEEMTGGTFTLSNGGIFGSLLSTPILNPPQTAILGMHKIQERPVAVAGEVKIKPMMYLALSYDHRMIDGREAVQFLVTIKDMLEDPARILLQM